MKKIIYLTIVDVSDKNGQGIYALKTLESFLKQESIFIDIVLPIPKDKKVLIQFGKYQNVRWHFLKEKKENRNIFWHFVVQLQLFIKLIRLGKKDSLIYSLKPMMLAPVLYSKLFKVKIYLLVEGLAKNTVKTLSSKSIVGKIGEFILNFNIKSSKKIYPAYLSAKKWVDEVSLSSNSEIINCGVDLNLFLPKKQRKTKKLTVGYVGSFDKRHILDLLISASEKLDVEIKLVGDGKEKSFLEEYANKHNLKNISFLGKKNQNELADFFSECDALWAVTNVTNWSVPIKCFEYLACNKKVIVSRKKDFNFIEEMHFGYVLDDTNIEAIKSLFEQIQEDYYSGLLQDNENSREYIIENNDWSSFGKIIMKDIQNDN